MGSIFTQFKKYFTVDPVISVLIIFNLLWSLSHFSALSLQIGTGVTIIISAAGCPETRLYEKSSSYDLLAKVF